MKHERHREPAGFTVPLVFQNKDKEPCLFHSPEVVVAEELLQVAFALLGDGILDLRVHLGLVGRFLGLAEDAEDLGEIGVGEAA